MQYGCFSGLHLPKYLSHDILQYAYSAPCYGNGKPYLGFYYKNKNYIIDNNNIKIAIADYYNTEKYCKSIRLIRNDPVLLEISKRYLGGRPVHQGNKLWWSFAANLDIYNQLKYGQTFHYDLDDHSALKIFFYITELDTEDRLHICVLGSHKKKKLSHKLLRHLHSDDKIIQFYGAHNLKVMHAQTGYGFLEDTFCMHKGMHPQTHDRLMLSIEFALRDYGMQHDIRDEKSLKMIRTRP